MLAVLFVLSVGLLVKVVVVHEVLGVEELAKEARSMLVEDGDDGVCARNWIGSELGVGQASTLISSCSQ